MSAKEFKKRLKQVQTVNRLTLERQLWRIEYAKRAADYYVAKAIAEAKPTVRNEGNCELCWHRFCSVRNKP